ncbi:MAG: Golgi to ER traffic-related protein, partial [Marteilia pararefringens]
MALPNHKLQRENLSFLKTNLDSTLAYSLAKKYSNESILLISTDPAHNLSDIYNQPFSGKPKPVASLKNLFVMEIDPTSQHDLASDFNSNYKESTINSLISSINHMTNADSVASSSSEGEEDGDDSASDEKEDILSYIPGIDEAIAVVKVLEFAQSSEYKYLIFDTAPTGHTLRLLHLPLMLNKLVQKFLRW